MNPLTLKTNRSQSTSQLKTPIINQRINNTNLSQQSILTERMPRTFSKHDAPSHYKTNFFNFQIEKEEKPNPLDERLVKMRGLSDILHNRLATLSFS